MMRTPTPLAVCLAVASALTCGTPRTPQPPAAPTPAPTTAATPPASSTATRSIASGPLTFEVSISLTAQTFYVIDELALAPNGHPQYERWATREGFLTDERRRLLADHLAVRRRVGPHALESTFGTTLDPTVALERAVNATVLSRDEVDIEARAFAAFGPIAKAVFQRRAAALEAFRDRLVVDVPKLGATFESLVTFAGAVPVGPIRVFLIADPAEHGSGGGSNGNTWWVEVTDGESMGTFLFDAFGSLLRQRGAEIAATTQACGNGLDDETLGQAIIEAFAPGVTAIALTGDDQLADRIAHARKLKTPATDKHLRISRFALALRPIVQSSIVRRTTFASFLANVCPMWTALQGEAWP